MLDYDYTTFILVTTFVMFIIMMIAVGILVFHVPTDEEMNQHLKRDLDMIHHAEDHH